MQRCGLSGSAITVKCEGSDIPENIHFLIILCVHNNIHNDYHTCISSNSWLCLPVNQQWQTGMIFASVLLYWHTAPVAV